MTATLDRRPREPSGRAVYLMLLLLLLFVAVPVLTRLGELGASGEVTHAVSRHALELLVGVVLVVAAVTVAQTERVWIVVLFLVGPPLTSRIVHGLGTELSGGLQAATSVYIGLALLYVVARGLQGLFSRSRVTVDTIATAICAYLLVGLAWMHLYTAAEAIMDGAFNSPTDESDRFYFSFVTLTTLGYGDVTPKLSTVRSLAIVEAIVGQMYLAIVVARLVSMYMRPGKEDPRTEPE